MTQDTQRTQDERTDSTGENNSHDPQRPRRNPRIVIGNLEFFELLMEHDE